MSQGESSPFIRRILVALDSSPASLSAMEQAIELAAGFEAEVIGLFVEDINLVRLAELAVTHEIGLFSAASRRLEIRFIERQFRGQASQARQVLARLADQAGVQWSFRVARGVIARELLSAALEADLIILGRAGSSALGRRRLGSTVRAILLQPPQLTIIFQPGSRLGGPILAFYDGSPAAQKALAAAAQLSRDGERRLTVLVMESDPATAKALQQEAEHILAAWPELTVRHIWHPQADITGLARAILAEGCQMLALPSESAILDNQAILALLAQVECPVLVAR